ncbi:MAG TPA: universal stress protein [Alphaproteobacteria bacterium]|nr:universal stress protein [Alphaproteobacteria bacterium]
MSIKTILAPITGYEATSAALASGMRLAKRLGAFVEVLHAQQNPRESVPFIAEGTLTSVINQYIAQAEKEAEARRVEAERICEEAARAAGVPATGPGAALRFDSIFGSAAQEVSTRGRVADLILVGRVPDDREVEWRLMVEAALIESGRPVLLMPAATRELAGVSVAIAWNGSMEAARAASAALPILHLAKHILILSGAKDAPVEPSPSRVGEWLARHGIAAKRRSVALEGWPVGEQLVTEAAGAGAELLVMGAYGHTRMRETIFGGATRSVLNESSLPVLLAH